MNKYSTDNGVSSRWWKVGVGVIVALMIAGAVIYTLTFRAPTSSNATNPNVTSSNAPASTVNESSIGGADELNWINNLSSKFESNDFIFVIFSDNDDVTQQVEQAVKAAIEKIKQDGTAIESMTLSSADPEFKASLERLAIQKLPAVLLMAPSGQGTIVKGDVTETKLLSAYVSQLKTCAPCNPGCCPGQ